MSETFQGVFPALVTPMTAEETVDCARLDGFVKYLIESGVHGLIPLGSTGEYYALTPDERRAVVTTTIEAAAGRVPILVGTNAGSTRDVAEFSQEEIIKSRPNKNFSADKFDEVIIFEINDEYCNSIEMPQNLQPSE